MCVDSESFISSRGKSCFFLVTCLLFNLFLLMMLKNAEMQMNGVLSETGNDIETNEW